MTQNNGEIKAAGIWIWIIFFQTSLAGVKSILHQEYLRIQQYAINLHHLLIELRSNQAKASDSERGDQFDLRGTH